ncbi:DUF2993 domain-containing protein [Geodermatophilus sp. YIM 151500]|uniref:LmeA family phospholipid-binding protein n=1 Tax=Geodermatophilus sp. YIM 151500 TaxID=2984531 RepID=UPI0021E51600|nr:DUF2993 domain-containing protein [Geodermatophilus sp. YIM 151500]MCV2490361.1 DUF2993 domain-containing protein [Geodermatophilus sp. YIM 151500]
MRALAVVLVALAGLLVVADRVAVVIAQGRVADGIARQGQLPGAPDVEIAGFPFLSQVVAGNYDEVRISFDADDLGRPGTRADVTLRGVQVPLSSALTGSVQQVPVAAIDGTATLSYDLLSTEFGSGTTLTPDGDGLRIATTVELLGRQVDLTASGLIELDDGDLVIDVREATGAGVDLPAGTVERLSEALDLRYRLPDLPYGLELTGVAPTPDGVDVAVAASETVIGT